MKTLSRCSSPAVWMTALVLAALPAIASAQGMSMPMQSGAGKAMPSPPAKAETTLSGKSITISYNSPSMRGRKIMGGLVPYGEPWRTGANPATTLVTPIDLMIGTLLVPAGTYTLFTLPKSATEWDFIVSKKTGEWGIPYPEGNDLGRSPMKVRSLPAPQEALSISFEHTAGNKTELHVKWETTDVWIPVVAK